MAFKHLTAENREVISAMRAQNYSHEAISKVIGCNISTVSRDILRNGDGKTYNARRAHARATERRSAAYRIPRKIDEAMWNKFIKMMEIYGSLPICARELGISATSLYKRVKKELSKGSHHKPKRLSRSKSKNISPFCNMRFGWYIKKNIVYKHLCAMADARPLHKRPKSSNTRKQYGHWEVDTVIYKCGVNVLSLVERKSRLWLPVLLPDKSAASVANAISKALRGFKVHTITSDHGNEFANWRNVEKILNIKWYACDVYRPDQRGSVENANGWLRWLIKRDTPAELITKDALYKAQEFINNRPRPILGHKSAAEIMGIKKPSLKNITLQFVG